MRSQAQPHRQGHRRPPAASPARPSPWPWLGPLLCVAVAALSFVGRHGGRWAEGDSALFSRYVRTMLEAGRLAPAGGELYPNGYAFQAIAAFIVALTGLEVAPLTQLVAPLLASLVVLPAWALYRELTGSARGAALATLLLFTQPEFLFVLLRGSHEKFTRALMLLCLYLLARSFGLRDRPGPLAAHIALFYLAAFALIAGNTLLAGSFIAATALAAGLGWLLSTSRRHLRPLGGALLPRLLSATLICLGLAYLFTFFIYEPARHGLLIWQSVAERAAALFLDVERRSTNPYDHIALGWIAPPVYLLVSSANWLILAASLVLWLRHARRWLWRGEAPAGPAAWLLWLLWAAFALQGALSVVVDVSGALGANLQHRLFPSFSIVAVALVGAALARWRPRRAARPLALALTLGVACLAALALLKATNEPLLSNKWTFYREEELVALDWSVAHLRRAEIWTEVDERLRAAYLTSRGAVHGPPVNFNRFTSQADAGSVRDLLVTSVSRLRAARLERPLPTPADALRVYDNGEAALYHRRPRTPYQR